MLVGDFQKKKRRKLDRTTGLHFPSEVTNNPLLLSTVQLKILCSSNIEEDAQPKKHLT